jgi:two-component system OmpR family sensor kinase
LRALPNAVGGRAFAAVQWARLRLPIRWKLATVSAALTFAILLLFALVVEIVTEDKLRSSADSELRATAADFQSQFQQLRIEVDPLTGQRKAFFENGDQLFEAAAAGGTVIRIVDSAGRELSGRRNAAPDLGRPIEGAPRDIGDYRVLVRPLYARSLDSSAQLSIGPIPTDQALAYFQYAKPRENLQSTVGRLRLFLLIGVLVGTGFAFIAGFAVARRAMRPISDLTKAAREVARTRDPARSPLPRPAANDEVAELAVTLSEMLQELDAARGETEAALERQREFVADASHELRTPLTSILANLELLEEQLGRRGTAEDQAATEIASSALRSSQRMRRLVGDLLLLARADAGQRPPTQPVDLAAVVREAAAEASAIAAGHPLTVDVPAEAAPAIVDGSRDDLHRLTLNLVENALLHTPRGTPVVVSVRADGDRIVLKVADRGAGIPLDQRDHVFERFARNGGDGAAAGGSGLGLAIVRAVAEAHGGTVRIRDAEGGGATFEVRLPSAAIRSPEIRVPTSEHVPANHPKGATHT